MGSKLHSSRSRGRTRVPIFALICLCCFFYLLRIWHKSGFGKGDGFAIEINKRQTNVDTFSSLSFETHHNQLPIIDSSDPKPKIFEPCDAKYTDYTSCHDQDRAMNFPRKNMVYRERHCPKKEEKLRCLVPAPKGYTIPFSWPKSRDYVYYSNVPFKSLTVAKSMENWVRFEGDVFKFLGGGVDAYIDELGSQIPIADGSIRTALDIGCNVASWGAYLMKRNIVTMSFAPWDNHEPRVQFALERGVPAVIGVLGTIKLPYPARAFDMAQCSRCLIQWTENDGMYLKEVDRVLRPGGYWILSGPTINSKVRYSTWKRSKQELESDQLRRRIEELAQLLCWEKIYEKGDVAIWRKKLNDKSCARKSVNYCQSSQIDDVWYKKLDGCVTPFPKVPNQVELKKFPARLYDIPPRVANGDVLGVTSQSYEEDNELWRKHVNAYKRIHKLLDTTRYRNVMDMNAGLGGFAAALESSKLWVMNVVPTIAQNTLGVVYERGLFGIYHDWCEGFSTYPRTYDLLHANGVFNLYRDKCEYEDILLEMDRILRPEGLVIFRDEVNVLHKVRKIVGGMRWETKMMDHEDGPLVTQKILIAVKKYWVGDADGSNMNKSISSR